MGSFFGQFGRRPIESLDAMDNELVNVYKNLKDLPLLYDDGESHLGDNAIVLSNKDKHLYRAEIIQELPNETVINFQLFIRLKSNLLVFFFYFFF